MRVSLNQIKKFIDFELPNIDELVLKINQQLGKVEAVVDLNSIYKDAVIVRVAGCHKHPDADRLSIVAIDDGGVTTDLPRDEAGYIQVVCGAPNVRADMYAVWLPPGATVPSSLNETDQPFTLDSRKLRGVMSHGMLAAADELAIGSEHDGIVEITDQDLLDGFNLHPGLSFAQVFELNDTVIEIENKMFTHRPDLFGQLGVAREIAAIVQAVEVDQTTTSQVPFTNPDWLATKPSFTSATSSLSLEVYNTAGHRAPRFMAVAMDRVNVKPSPLWLKCALVAMGSKPINNIVDITNYVMLITAQPTHAYDYDKLDGQTIGARMAEPGEKIELLNGKTYELTAGDVVIADQQKPVGLGGIMGSQASQVSEATTKIVLESANFDMYAVRRSSMRHGLFTDAVTRFNKGQSVLQCDRVINYMIQLISQLSGAVVATEVYDLQTDQLTDNNYISVTPEFINQRLGSDLNQPQITSMLQLVNFTVTNQADAPIYQAPFWRTDIEVAEDIVEEVGRLYGFEKLPRQLPLRRAQPTAVNQTVKAKSQLRQALAKYGANETLSYSFVNSQTIRAAGQNPEQAYRIKNALSPDLQYYRLSLTPSLLEKIHPNIKAGHDKLAIFEIGKYHDKLNLGVDSQGVPVEATQCDVVLAAKDPGLGASYYEIKQLIEDALAELNIAIQTRPYDSNSSHNPGLSVYEPNRLAAIYHEGSDHLIGFAGEIKQSVKKAFKLPDYCAAATLDMAALVELIGFSSNNYQPLSKYPSVQRDITIQVASQQNYSQVIEAIQSVDIPESVSVEISPVSIYQPEAATTKNITLHIKLTSAAATMDSQQAAKIMQTLTEAASASLQAKIV